MVFNKRVNKMEGNLVLQQPNNAFAVAYIDTNTPKKVISKLKKKPKLKKVK